MCYNGSMILDRFLTLCCLAISLLLGIHGATIAEEASSTAIAELPQLPAGQLLFVVEDVYSTAEYPPRKGNPQQAENCFQRGLEACREGNLSDALQWATLAVRADPDHEGARRVLGYRQVAGQWAGSYAARRLERDEIWHPEYGWVEEKDLPRYEAGERLLGRRWIDQAEDAKRHATLDQGWRIRTDHFLVTTNHSRRAAADLATRLEVLYQLWRQLFGEFYLSQRELLRRFEGNAISGYRREPFEVVYYRTRKEYNVALLRRQPQIGITLGIYFDKLRQTHFFAGEEQDPGTIYHETVHQFFQESNRTAHSVGALHNAWIVEGVACYFESLREYRDEGGTRFFTLGTPAAGRMPAAIHRRLVDDYYVPLATLSQLGTTDLQRRNDVARLYSQSAGLATFLVESHRSALVELLQQVYAGRDKPDSLETLTGQSFADLDREYLEYLQRLAEGE